MADPTDAAAPPPSDRAQLRARPWRHPFANWVIFCYAFYGLYSMAYDLVGLSGDCGERPSLGRMLLMAAVSAAVVTLSIHRGHRKAERPRPAA